MFAKQLGFTWVSFYISELRIAKDALAKKSSKHPIMVVESQPFGGDLVETMPIQESELDGLAKSFHAEEPELPSAPLVSWPLLNKPLQVLYFKGSILYCPCWFPFKCWRFQVPEF